MARQEQGRSLPENSPLGGRVYPAKGKAKTDYLLGLMDFIIDDMRRWHQIHKIIKESDNALDHMSRTTHYEAYKEEMEKGTLNIIETKV